MSKHTPGPWDVRKIDSVPSFRGVFAICSNGGPVNTHIVDEEEKANHRLISAAPDMLHALKVALVELAMEEGSHAMRSIVLQRISDAIGKAEGK